MPHCFRAGLTMQHGVRGVLGQRSDHRKLLSVRTETFREVSNSSDSVFVAGSLVAWKLICNLQHDAVSSVRAATSCTPAELPAQ